MPIATNVHLATLWPHANDLTMNSSSCFRWGFRAENHLCSEALRPAMNPGDVPNLTRPAQAGLHVVIGPTTQRHHDLNS
jgi:hypothetical protein